jgi:dephospho-CoA kinase
MQRIRSIGLTGGIGSGKSTVAAALRQCGAAVVDTDALARELTAPGGGAVQALRDAFGDAAIGPDGALDRPHMRALAFADPHTRARLEAVLHPRIAALAAEREAQARAGGADVVVFDVPLLTETGHWRERVQRVLVIDCDEATQAARVAARPGWTLQAAQAVMAQQATRAARRAVADAVIVNDGIALDHLHALVHRLWARWTASGPPAPPVPMEQ